MYSCLQLQVVPVDDGCIKQSPQGTVTRFANLACKLARQYEELSRTTKEHLAKGAIILKMSREGACLGGRGPRKSGSSCFAIKTTKNTADKLQQCVTKRRFLGCASSRLRSPCITQDILRDQTKFSAAILHFINTTQRGGDAMGGGTHWRGERARKYPTTTLATHVKTCSAQATSHRNS